MFRNRDEVILTNSPNRTRGLDATALDEYSVGGLRCVRFKQKRDAPGFNPALSETAGHPGCYACQLLLLSVPEGFRRINLDEIRDEHGHRENSLPHFGPHLAEPAGPVEPVLLHVIYDLDTTPTITGAGEAPLVTQDHCAGERPKGVTYSGTLTPCAKSSATSWSGSGPDAQGLFVRYAWRGIYNNAEHEATNAALESLFNGKDEVALAAMIAPDRTVIWIPFLEGEEIAGDGGAHTVVTFQDNVPYELGRVVYLDKPGIWVDPELRFRV
ncbi:hypothetical protein GGR26_000176 [Lewinella marina]|uniref:Uncharacterized protein n=1 Tax=Neolewinella marina TaxID=438751 RepID=A0A2G0CK77_9BACT|nr:hypothetical protein [Neolewinella marina]NJB84431.1 hypothetical protein [Neolewinella marina]PHL00377.1 hypothetical protein CGL56_04905 [Neolewinella marina]